LPDPFEYKQPSPAQLEALEELRELARLHLAAIQKHARDARYRALAITTLEEVSMWANKSVTHG
jgi:hypothetical protein